MLKANQKRYAKAPRLEAHELGNPHFAVRNPIVPGLGDFECIPLRSYYGIAVATATILQQLFTVIAGGQFNQGGLNFIQSALHTSMTKQNELPNPRKHLARDLVCFLDNRMNPVDVTRILSESLFSFIVGQKTYAQDVLAQCGGGGGAHLQSTQNAVGVQGSGMPYSANCYKLQQVPYGQYVGPDGAVRPGVDGVTFPGIDGVVIEQGQNFRVVIDPTGAQQFNAAGVGFTTAAAAATPAGIGVHLYFHIRGPQLIEVQ